MDPKQRSEALPPVRSIGRITAFARDGCICWITHIEPDVGSTPVFHKKQKGRHQNLTAVGSTKYSSCLYKLESHASDATRPSAPSVASRTRMAMRMGCTRQLSSWL